MCAKHQVLVSFLDTVGSVSIYGHESVVVFSLLADLSEDLQLKPPGGGKVLYPDTTVVAQGLISRVC